MIPSKLLYPDFVPDQLLTSEDLNSLFGYLDEQGRLTRTNLIGVGIVCGLAVQTEADGSAVTVTKGTGVTGEGYLVVLNESKFNQYIEFDAEKEIHYEKFLDASNKKKFDLWELKRPGAVEGATAVNLDFLTGNGVGDQSKVVLLFVELLKEEDKNCNPESCDDKGATIYVNTRVLLARRIDVETHGLNLGLDAGLFDAPFAALPEAPFRRFDVPATPIVTSADLFTAYQTILTPSALQNVENFLTNAWNVFEPIVGPDYGHNNPFAQVADGFSFLNDGSITPDQLTTIQYCYDHFIDLLAAYREFRHTGMEVLTTCCPDASLFPRHLLLGLAVQKPPVAHLPYRHYFQYSPLFEQKELLGRLKTLFHRMVLMAQDFAVPPPAGAGGSKPDDSIRITPSRLDTSSLSKKAIPYYYPANEPTTSPLYRHWNYEKTRSQIADTNLSYHAPAYSTKDFVTRPLAYDLEPYNFLRIEGHVGKPLAHVLSNLRDLIASKRLPLKVIALALGDDASATQLIDPHSFVALQAQYDALRSEILCCLRGQTRYWGRLNTQKAFRLDARVVRTTVVTPSSEVVDKIKLGTIPKELENTKKGKVLYSLLGTETRSNLAREYLRYQQRGDFSLERLPSPESVVFGRTTLEHRALIILDELQELAVLLEAENPLRLSVDDLEAHGDALEKTRQQLTEEVEKHLDARIPLATLQTYLGESQSTNINAVSGAISGLSESDAFRLVILFLNQQEANNQNLIAKLNAATDNLEERRALIEAAFKNLDQDGIKMPPKKEVIVSEDTFFTEMRERLKDLCCICALSGFRVFRERLLKWIEEMRKLNLFVEFTRNHPGIQHKAGVPFGGTFILAYHQRDASGSGKANPAYVLASQKLQESVVVADFFLPYICCSNQPPIQFAIAESPRPPEEVTLDLETNPVTGTHEYSVGDQHPYAFTLTPDSGTLENGNSGNGVTSPTANQFFFTPSRTRTNLGSNNKLEIEFIYSKQGVSSPPLVVVVYRLPAAKIALAENPEVWRVGDFVSLVSTTRQADEFTWEVKLPSGQIETNRDAKDLSGYPLKLAGQYAFTLFAGQQATGAQVVSNTVTVSVRKSEQIAARKCGSLASAVEQFLKLESLDPNGFDLFSREILKGKGVQEFMEQVEGVAGADSTAQLVFFQNFRSPQDLSAVKLIHQWTDEIVILLANRSSKVSKLLLMDLYRLLGDILFVINCLSDDDLGEDQALAITALIAHVEGRDPTPGFSKMELPEEALKRLEMWKADIEAEIERQAANDALTPKPNYTELLKQLFEAMQ